MTHSKTRYRLPLWTTLASTVPALFFLVLGLALLPRWVWTICTAVWALVSGNLLARELFEFMLVGWIPFMMGATLLSLYTEFDIADEGMRVRVFAFKWVFIPWEDVLGLTLPRIPGGNDPRLWHFVRVRKLTPFHRLLSLSYQMGADPVLPIHRRIENYEMLVQIIEEHIEQNRRLAEDTGGS